MAQDTSVKQVEIQKRGNLILDYFEKKWKLKFDEIPILEEDDKACSKWMAQAYSLEKSKELIDRYLGWGNEWIAGQGYPLRLLKKNINAIVANTAYKKDFKWHNKRRGKLCCDSCWVEFECVYDRNANLDASWIKCSKCLQDNAPWKYPTKEEFYKNWQTFDKTMGQEGVIKVPFYEQVFKEKLHYPEREILFYQLV